MINWIHYSPLGGLQPSETTGTVNGTVVLTAGTVAFAKAPTAGHGGGILIAEAFAHIKLGSAATMALVDMGTGGTSVAGTIATFGTSWADTPVSGTPSDYWLSAGKYLGLKWSAGTITCGPNCIAVGYKMGRAGS